MNRQAIDGGGWIDLDAAEKFTERRYSDGRNLISAATGSQWEHEALYCSRKGVYVVNWWSQCDGVRETWTRIDAQQAAQWLVHNGHEPPAGELARALDELEV